MKKKQIHFKWKKIAHHLKAAPITDTHIIKGTQSEIPGTFSISQNPGIRGQYTKLHTTYRATYNTVHYSNKHNSNFSANNRKVFRGKMKVLLEREKNSYPRWKREENPLSSPLFYNAELSNLAEETLSVQKKIHTYLL